MTDLRRQFQDAFAAQQQPDSEGPSDVQGQGDEAEGGDMTCPTCGASALKIAKASQQGGGGAMGGGMGGMK
jgi:hypothetical protein